MAFQGGRTDRTVSTCLKRVSWTYSFFLFSFIAVCHLSVWIRTRETVHVSNSASLFHSAIELKLNSVVVEGVELAHQY